MSCWKLLQNTDIHDVWLIIKFKTALVYFIQNFSVHVFFNTWNFIDKIYYYVCSKIKMKLGISF